MLNLLLKFLLTIVLFSAFTVYSQSFDGHSRTLKASKGGSLEIRLSSGDILIHTWNKNEALIKYEDDGSVKIIQNRNKIMISDDNWGDTDVEITVPQQFNIDANTSGGDVIINDRVTGEIKIFTAGGDIILKDVNGNASVNTSGGDIFGGDISGNVKFRTSGGDISLGTINGTTDVHTSGGDITIKRTLKSIEVKTSGGNIILGEIQSDAEVSTSGGNITAEKTYGKVSFNTAGGNIIVKGVEGSASVMTAGGNLKIENISGNLTAKTAAGDIYTIIANKFTGNIDLETSNGTVKILLPENIDVTVNAQVDDDYYDDDNIKSDFKASSFNKDGNTTKAVYKLNGGGKNTINVKVVMGDIEIRKK